MTLEKLLTALIFKDRLLGDGARMRKITILGQLAKRN